VTSPYVIIPYDEREVRGDVLADEVLYYALTDRSTALPVVVLAKTVHESRITPCVLVLGSSWGRDPRPLSVELGREVVTGPGCVSVTPDPSA